MDDIEQIETEPVDDIVADIRIAAEQASQKSPEPEAPAGEERQRGPDGKFIKVEREADVSAAPTPVTDAGPQAEQPQQPSTALMSPTSWSAEAKALWPSLPPALQQAVSKRESEMAEGTRQRSEERQTLERVLSPLQELSQSNGIHWQDGLNRLLSVEARLRDPGQAPAMIVEMAQAYGVDLAALANGNPQPQPAAPQFNPNVIPTLVSQQVNQTLENLSINSQINSFKADKDASGNQKHPHFEAVKQTMGFLLTSGKAADMEDAYTKAIWMNPDMRPAATMAQPAAQVQRAKRAAVSPSGAPGDGPRKANGYDKAQTLEDDIRESIRSAAH